jgi:hypothetical protein
MGYTDEYEEVVNYFGSTEPCTVILVDGHLTEAQYFEVQLKRATDKELKAELMFLRKQLWQRFWMLQNFKKNGLTIEMVRDDVNAIFTQYDAITAEMERRVIP